MSATNAGVPHKRQDDEAPGGQRPPEAIPARLHEREIMHHEFYGIFGGCNKDVGPGQSHGCGVLDFVIGAKSKADGLDEGAWDKGEGAGLDQ